MKIFSKIDSRGLSLPEMLIALAVMTILVGMVSVFVLRAFHANRFAIEQGLNTSALQGVIKNFVTNLREAKQSDDGGYLLESGDDFEIVFFANIDDDDETERLHYYLEDGQLKLGITEPSSDPIGYPEEDGQVRIISSGMVNNETQPLFFYFDRDYPVNTSNSLITPITPGDVSMVKLDIYMNVNTDQIPNSMHMETYVRPRNIDY